MSPKRTRKRPLKVVPIDPSNLADIPGQLRGMAEAIERGELTIERIITITEGPEGVELYGWGTIDGLRAVGLQTIALAKMNRDILTQLDGGE